MNKNNFSEAEIVAPKQLNLLNSQRLRALSGKKPTAAPPSNAAAQNPRENASTARLRQEIDRRLSEIMAGLPAGKQHNLFKIRYGVTPDEIRQLPVEQAAQMLKLAPAKS